MPPPSQLLLDAIAGKQPAKKELGFFLDSLVPLLGLGGNDLRKTVGVLGRGGPITQIVAGNGLTGGGDHDAVTLNVGAGNGISVLVDSVAVDQGFSPTWTGLHAFAQTLSTHSIVPATTDTYDLGSSVKPWRKGWLSELDAIVFAKNTVTLIGGWLVVSKNEGSFPADTGLGSPVDFGQAMTPGDFVLCRGSLQVEYMQVGALDHDTTYAVTRNLDGTGANNWLMGTPYMVLGSTGKGRIELNAYDTPRLSIIVQGATWDAQTEVVRLGDLNGWGAFVAEGYGVAIGDYAGGNYLTYNPTAAPTGFAVHAGGGDVLIDANGVGFSVGTGWAPSQGIRFLTGATDIFHIFATNNAGTYAAQLVLDQGFSSSGLTAVSVSAQSAAGATAQAYLTARAGVAGSTARIYIENAAGTLNGYCNTTFNITAGLNVGAATGAGAGDVRASAKILSMVDGIAGGLCAGALADVQWYRDTGPILRTVNNVTIDGGLNLGTASGAAAGEIAMPNNISIKQKDAGGTLRSVLYIDNGNNLNVGRSAFNGNTQLFIGNATGDWIFFDSAVSERARITHAPALKFLGTQVVSTRKTGWAAWTGTATRTSKDTTTATVGDCAQAIKALIDDLMNHGLIGA